MAFLDYDGLEYFIDKVRDEAYDAWRDKIQEYIDDSYDYQRLVYVTAESYLPKSLRITGGSELCDGEFANNDSLFTIVALYWDGDNSGMTDVSYAFSGCTSLTYADLSWLDLTNCESISNMFKNCTMLSTLRIILPDLDVDLSYCPLNEESIEYIINHLPVGSGHSLYLSETSYSYVTEDLLLVAENKTWHIEEYANAEDDDGGDEDEEL